MSLRGRPGAGRRTVAVAVAAGIAAAAVGAVALALLGPDLPGAVAPAFALPRVALAELKLPISPQSLEIRGSGAMGALARAVAEQYMADHKDTLVTIQTSGSQQGIKSLLVGTSALAMGTDEVPEELEKLAKERGVELLRTDVYRDALAVVVHPQNPVKSLTLKQLHDIFKGTITNWKELGGPDAPILVWTLSTTSATYEVFKRIVLGPDAVMSPKAVTVKGKQIQEGIPESAITYVGLSQVAKWSLSAVTIGGVVPSAKSVSDGSYPIVRRMSLYQRAPGTPLAQSVIDAFFAPDKGRKLILEAGNVPIPRP
jgi:phosphate transport system substrate-binding protein